MRRSLILGATGLIGLFAVWFFTARWCSGLIDHVYTVRLAALPATPVGWNGVWLQFGATVGGVDGPKDGWNAPDLSIGSHLLGLEGPAPAFERPAKLTIDAGDHLILTASGRTIPLGTRTGTIPGGDGTILAYTAEPGDHVSMTLERSVLSWPTPFEMNFMTGYTHSWYRRIYYRLIWQKASGERLEMLWRYEQGFHKFDGWTAPGGPDTATGLIRVAIKP